MQVKPKSLVQYKKSPAIVLSITDKIEIKLSAQATKKVRDKDIILLHLGPTTSLDFPPLTVDEVVLREISELLATESVDLAEFSELLFGDANVASVWASWQIVQQNLYFSGDPSAIKSNSIEYAEQKLQQQQQQLAKKQAENDFLQRLKTKQLTDKDFAKITDIEQLALLQRDSSILFKKIGMKQNPQTAHQYLIDVGYWHKFFNPYPLRKNLINIDPNLTLPDLPAINRVDLTHLPAFAIDDIGNTDPDDAISIDGDTIWVHIADVAELVTANSDTDLVARRQMANLYLPEGVFHMLPITATQILGLGLSLISPALSISFKVNENGLTNIQICKSHIKATRISYQDAETNPQISDFFTAAQNLKTLRVDAVNLHFAEVKVSVLDNKTSIRQLEPLFSRDIVMEFMLAAGVATAKFALKNNLPFIFSSQILTQLPEDKSPTQYSAMLALRKKMTRSLATTAVEFHNGLGLEVYSQVTSPLRRYFDLVNHQQLTAFLAQQDVLTTEEIKLRINSVNSYSLKKVEREANLHWKCVYLLQNNNWQGEAIIMQLETHKTLVFIAELALEVKIKANTKDKLDHKIKLAVTTVNLPELAIFFKRI